VNDFIIGTLLIPLIIGFFKQEIVDFFTDLRIYKNRDIDGDGDPATGNTIFIQCEPDRYIEVTVLEYRFALLPHQRKIVTLQRANIDKDELIVILYTYAQWNSLIKGVPKAHSLKYQVIKK